MTLVEIASQLQAGADAVLSSSSYAVVPASAWAGARKDPDTLAELAERGTRYSMVATLPVVVAVAMLAAPVIDVWLGPEYLDAAQRPASRCSPSRSSRRSRSARSSCSNWEAPGSSCQAALVSIGTNLVLSLVLVQLIGLVGVFVGTLISTLVEIRCSVQVLRRAGIGGWTFLHGRHARGATGARAGGRHR
ncbi:MAG: oligosaccharide flippase family protein [Microthrixaceae bacterium]